MIATLVILGIIGLTPIIYEAVVEDDFMLAILRWISVLALIYFIILGTSFVTKREAIKSLNGNCTYEKQYISNDSGVIDSIYVKR